MSAKFCALMMLVMFMDNSIYGFQFICNITKVNKYYFCWDLNFLDCTTYKIHKIEYPTNNNDFTIHCCIVV